MAVCLSCHVNVACFVVSSCLLVFVHAFLFVFCVTWGLGGGILFSPGHFGIDNVQHRKLINVYRA